MRHLSAASPPLSVVQRSREAGIRPGRRRPLMPALLLAALAGLHAGPSRAAETPIGTWVTQEGDARVRIEPCDRDPERLCGRITWVAEPPDPGEPSPVGVRLLSGFAPDDHGGWGGGEVVDPRSGKTYAAKLALRSPDRLEVSGCLLFFCAGQTWARYGPETARGTVAAGAAGGHS
jgi:uncharacterized protein (DUF2147 family)